jgi:hypothetical protein
VNKQDISARIGSKMNALGYNAIFTSGGMEVWKKQLADGCTTISAHDTDAQPLFPDNHLHAALDANVWTVDDYDSKFILRDGKKDLTLDEAIAMGAAYESARQKGSL